MLKGTFFGRFKGLVLPGRNTSEIGRGGSGVIHLVRDTVLERNVALKLPHESILGEPQAKHEVQHEASQALELTHPNIVRIYDFHDVDGRWGISMQHIRGKNLDEWRTKLAPWQSMGGAKSDIRFYDVEHIKDWVRQLCSALSYVHEANIIHCDIKPKNLLLERSIDTSRIDSRQIEIQERLVITDFGITQKLRNHTTRVTHTKQLAAKQQQRRTGEESGDERGGAGTLAYMSPQLLAGDDPRPTDDIYAVGVTIYELLTGRPPFFQGEAELIHHQIQTVVPPLVSERRAKLNINGPVDIPQAWDEAVAACLAKNPNDRPASVGALAAMLGLSIEAAIPGSRPSASTHEVITLQTTVAEQQALIVDQQSKIDSLARRVSASMEENAAEIQRLTSERDAVITQHDALQHEVQILDQQCSDLNRQLAQLQENQDDGDARAEMAELSNQVTELTATRATLEKRIKDADDELKRAKLQLDESKKHLSVAQERLDRSEANEEKLKKERATAVGAKAKAEAELADARKKADELAEEKRLAERAAKQIDDQLKKAKAENAGLREEFSKVSDQVSSPVKMVVFTMIGIVLIGLIGGWFMGKSSGPSIEKPRREIVAAATGADASGMVVTTGQFRTFLTALGVEKSEQFKKIMNAGKAEEAVTGVSWLLAASFCEWLTEEAQAQSGDADSTSKRWFDLPTYSELAKASKTSGGPAEWTSEDGPGQGGNAPQAAHRPMRVFDSKDKDASRVEYRDESKPDIGFRCIIRTK